MTDRPIATVALAGVGLIGGSIGLGIRRHGVARRIVGFDVDPVTLEAAHGMGVVDETWLSPGPWLGEVDLLVLAAPSGSLVQLAEKLLPHLKDGAVVTDVGSVKGPVVDGVRELLARPEMPRISFVGGHPMAGSERGGVLAANAGLMENAVWVLTPEPGTDTGALDLVRDFVTRLGARPIEISPEQHDGLAATVSHLPYLAAVALTGMVDEGEDRDLKMLLAAGGFRDLTRVASGDPRMSRDMVFTNRGAVLVALRRFREQLDSLESLLEEPATLLERAEAAKRARDGIPIVKRGLLPARYEATLAVLDQPGELARITRALADADINVKDLEVLNVRESGGAVRLAFESEEQLIGAARALGAIGYQVRTRNGNGDGAR
ncbi:MAG: prephenate dehydrogenase [Trueperaceae bacterium]|nr:prephenate dehydrogenase [Trueperaceae bacterium]